MARPPARVLMTADAVGGVWTYALELAGELCRRGSDVALAVMGGGVTPVKRAEAAAIRGITLFEHEAKLEWMDDPWRDVARAGEWLLDIAARFQPDLVHLNGYAHATLAWSAPVVVAAHSCVLSWFQAVRKRDAPAEWNPYRHAVRAGLMAADLVVAPSQAMLDSLDQNYGVMRNACVIANGRNPGSFTIETKEKFVLAAGRMWDEAKNFRILAEVAPQLDWPVFAAGSLIGPHGDIVDGSPFFDGSPFANSGLHLLGNLNAKELSGWYARASLFALPSLYEPFGYSALEAALSGCTLVLSDIASLREIWGEAAVFVPPQDASAWRVAFQRLSRDPQRLADLAQAAHRRALQLSSDRMTGNYLSAYQQARENRPLCASFSSAIHYDPTGTMGTRTFYGD